MADQSTIAEVHRVLIEEFELSEADVVSTANIYTDLGLDSLDTVDLAVALERAFAFKVDRAVDEKKIKKMQTVGDIYAFVAAKMESAPQ